MSEQKPNLDSLFEEAAKIESQDERSAFLEQSCGDDVALRQQVEQLLISDQQAGSFLEEPPIGLEATISNEGSGEDRAASLEAGLTSAFSSDEAVVVGDQNHSVLKMLGQTLGSVPRVALRDPAAEGDDPIAKPNSPEIPHSDSDGRYRLDGEIARGGMGAIIKGRDTDLGRDLVIKVLLDAHKDKPEVIQRFVEEAQIGGQLQHPGIAPIYELGQFADQRPFFAMKLVKGETLAKLLADREETTDERGKLIGIFEQICQTMAYAHSRGVIHRDLKPANIMVGAFGEVQVMDWGLAKVLSTGGVADEMKAKQTQQGQSIIQTIRSTGSDVPGSDGSVGTDTQMGSVMGTPAYMPPEQALGEIDLLDERADVFGLGAILCEILTGMPPYVGDAGTQVYRLASRGKLDDAFARLDECATDSELIALSKHCLELEPANRPKDASVLAERITKYLESVEQKLRDTELAKVDAQVRAEELRRRQRLAYTAGTAIVATLVIGISASLWQMVRATTAEKKTADTLLAVASERDAKELAREDAEQISTFLSEVLQSPDPTKDGREIKVVELLDNAAEKLETDLADQPERRAKLQKTLGVTYYTLGLYRQAFPLLEQVREYYLTTSGPEHPDTLQTMHVLGACYMRGGRRDEAGKLAEEVLTLRRKVNGPEHDDTLSAMGQLAIFYFHTGRRDEALKLREEVLTLRRKVNGPERDGTLRAMGNLANSYRAAGREDEALKLREEVLPLSRKVLGPEHPHTLSSMHNLASSYHAVGRRDEALKLREEVLPLRRKVNGPEHDDTLRAMDSLATSYHDAGRQDEALKLREEKLALSRNVLGPEHPDTLAAMARLADSYLAAGRRDEAIEAHREAIKLDPKNANAHNNLGVAYRDQGQLDEAVAVFRKAIEVDPANADYHDHLGWVLMKQEKLDEAIPEYRKAIELDPTHGYAYSNLANALKQQGKTDEAIAVYRKAIEVRPNDLAHSNQIAFQLMNMNQLDESLAVLRGVIELDPKNAEAYVRIGDVLERKNMLEAAAASHRKAIEIDPKFAFGHINLGGILGKQGKAEEAIAELRLGIELASESSGWQLPYGHRMLGDFLLEQSKVDEAIAEYRKAIELNSKDAESLNNLAWLLATTADKNGQYPHAQEAVKLSRRANELATNNPGWWLNTLGVALYRAEQYQEAIGTLQRSTELGFDLPINWLFIAMAHWQLDEKSKALQWYEKSLAWKEDNQADVELQGFYAEAAKLMAPGNSEGLNSKEAAEAPLETKSKTGSDKTPDSEKGKQ